ncbi:MAG: hypothetical protein K6G30_07600, partial [Acetatifactor sp.]|nr:hypothetical protein [Acetatifactor sp.]
MSAIWGMLSLSNAKPLPSDIDNLMEHTYRNKCRIDRVEGLQSGNCYMGCGVQYFTREAVSEILPIYDAERKLFFTADCILDNRAELFSKLADATLPSDTPDGTLMYHAYIKWGIDCVKHFRGLFALAVYDKKLDALYLAADQTSSRCVYYYQTEDSVIFSSLIEPIRRVYPALTHSESYLCDFLTIPGLMPNLISTETPWENLFLINPGTYLRFSKGQKQEICYWTPAEPLQDCHCRTASECGTYFRSLYQDCVACALRTDGNVGISLSSGLDSASVGALAADLLAAKGQKLYTYTYVPFEEPIADGPSGNVYDETEDVKKIVAMHP